jgi:lysophospholipase L1-like esterase
MAVEANIASRPHQKWKLIACVMAGVFLSNAATGQSRQMWLGAWGHAPRSYSPGELTAAPDTAPNLPPAQGNILLAYENVTVRQTARISAAAKGFRLRFSNEFGEKPVLLGGVSVALAGRDGAIVPGSRHIVTFAENHSVTIPAGSPILSDTIYWALPALTKLAVTVYFPVRTAPPAHTLFTLSSYASSAGNFLEAEMLPGASRARTGNFLSEIDILPVTARHVVVAFGDSLTEGAFSTIDSFTSWPDRLAERLQQNRTTQDWSVVNAGIGSNRLLYSHPGMSALARFDRDVLSVPGAAAVIILEGINDIQYGHRIPSEAVTSQEMIDALRQLIVRAHIHGLRAIGATLMPFGGSTDYTDENEKMRDAVNSWIRSSGEFDGVIDFDAATRDPNEPTHLLRELEAAGHLHLNDAGYVRMGDAIDLDLFK